VTATGPKTVLVVDDESLFLRTVDDGFAAHSQRLNVLTAPNGRVAVEILERCSVDLVVTDLRMPEMDGFELMAHMSRSCPEIPVIVMTAFGTPDVESRLERNGVAHCLDKPLDFPALARTVFEALAASASGHLQGIMLPTLLQMIDADRKTCTVRVRSQGQVGLLYFQKGELVDAELGPLRGEPAALVVVGWEQPEIEILGGRVQRPRQIEMSLSELLLEGLRQKDEEERTTKRAGGAWGAQAIAPGSAAGGILTESIQTESIQKEADVMAASDKLKELAGIEGFAGAAVYTPTGEPLAVLAGDSQHLKDVGVLANNVLLNAQKASIEMGTGRGQQVHVEAEKAHIFARCLNEGTDPLKSQPGKAHVHLILVLKNDSSIGLAKLRVNSVIEKLAEEFRM
jgi:CheY-like chemotaxis protein/predicted regulator of Ras-like GTPase activity (Roadblock/LC7/MglB family)